MLQDGDFLISQDFSSSEQNSPSISVGLPGTFAVVWTDYRFGDGDIFCRLYDSGAAAIGDEFILNDDGSGAWQYDPGLSSDWYGNYYAVWQDYRNGSYPFGPDIYYQRLDSTGMIGSNRNMTTEKPDSSRQSPAVAVSGWGKTIVAWSDLRNRNWDVFAQMLESSGDAIGGNFKVNTDLSLAAQHEPALAVSPWGWFVIAWYDGRNGNDDIYLQKYDSAGTAVGINVRINDDDAGARQKFPAVTVGGTGVIFVTWTDWRNGEYPANPDIYAQRLDSNLNRLGDNFLVNLDGSSTAQRDPRIASDRTGNACIVWSDSSISDWNVTGQMFEYTGLRRGQNFRVNADTPGKQLRPDVALDGYCLYATWVDDRNGNPDIYGRVTRYNTPSLTATPDRLSFAKDRLDADPEAVMVAITNAGYGELSYRLATVSDWITLSKTTGTTPDTVLVGVNSAGLGYGLHQGVVNLIDIDHSDSTGLLPVLCEITGPIIELQPDSLAFDTLVEIGAPNPQNILVTNSGSGGLGWSLTATEDWITFDKAAGIDGDVVSIGCDISALITGNYSGYVIVDDTAALNAPESLAVHLRLQSNLVYLASSPDSVIHELYPGGGADDSVRIINLGGSVSDWTASCGAPWLTMVSDSGRDNDIIEYSISAADLIPGRYTDSIMVTDTLAFNNPLAVAVVLDVVAVDTLVIFPAQATPGDGGQTQVYLHNHSEIDNGFFTLVYDRAMLRVDSVVPPSEGELAGRIATAVDTVAGEFIIAVAPDVGLMAPGEHFVADIYFTANDSIEGMTGFEAKAAIDSFYVEDGDGHNYRPVLEAGEIEISSPTFTDGRGGTPLPAAFSLGQNLPNPFNGSTAIPFSLDRSGPVRLEVYNILGQRVRILADADFPPGEHRVSWDGRDDWGGETASGVYFCMMSVSGESAVRKMVYLK